MRFPNVKFFCTAMFRIDQSSFHLLTYLGIYSIQQVQVIRTGEEGFKLQISAYDENILQTLGHGGGQVVSVIPSYSDHLSSNPAEKFEIVFEKNAKKAGVGPLIFLQTSLLFLGPFKLGRCSRLCNLKQNQNSAQIEKCLVPLQKYEMVFRGFKF